MRAPVVTLNDQVKLEGRADSAQALLSVVGLVGLGLGGILGWRQGDGLSYFLHSYLTSYCFFLSITLGALFFVLIQHATRAGWSVAVRRIAEILAANIPILAILFLPILLPMFLDNHRLYLWSDAAVVAQDAVLRHKEAYLNLPFFAVRCLLYFAVWWALSRFFLRSSTHQDASGDPTWTTRMERWSGPALILYALTVTFAAFDWLMSLEPRWFSTIYGVYVFGGAFLAGLATIILVAIALQARGWLVHSITAEHYHDLGKLLFGFVIFWGYIAFSQYLLIWYANIPEETIYYRLRQSNGWATISLLLLFGHLFIPFLGLLPRAMKRRKAPLVFWSIWLLVFHWLDLYWLVMPTCSPQAGPSFGLTDLALLVGLGSLFGAGVLRIARDRALVPMNDPRLSESLAFENV